MTVKLNDLYFGYADGDTESSRKNFLDLFYTGNYKYQELTENKMKFIITGRKGTGKTILGRYVEKTYNKKGIKCKMFNKNELALIKLIEKSNDKLNSDEIIPFFKWFIYWEIYNLLINKQNKLGNKPFRKLNSKFKLHLYIKKLKKIYNERYPRGNFEFNEMFISNENLTNVELAIDNILKVKPKLSGFFKKTQNITNKKKDFYKVLSEVEELIVKCLKYQDVVILLDDLDELNIDSSSSSLESIKKLIEAFKDINTLFLDKDLKDSKCIILLRSDILYTLNKYSANLNKIIIDNTVELYWITKEEKSPEKHIIIDMLFNKIKYYSHEYRQLDNKLLYEKLFPKDISGSSALKFLIDNSFGRPRDIISYLDIMAKRYPDKTTFKQYMFRECAQQYSQRFLQELQNELHMHLDPETAQDYLNLISQYGRNSFFFKDIKNFYKQHRRNFSNIKNLNKCMQDLYNFGVLGNSWRVHRNTANEAIKYSWGYRKDGNPYVDMEKRFTVHRGLRKALNTN
ncbi:hypothetical protein Z957_05090 [Clostridium sp. K25]|uniref:P-loop ATPase, Sll1717 family n=1 Tax=Clostridium sp. K25 TaxID=1443109 RepID=UPI0004D9636C|nr:hypothetical protein [Clostridium sp. K25]KEI09283.1 hypothetical protein Z957_05090 [Clostridium sp. K25]